MKLWFYVLIIGLIGGCTPQTTISADIHIYNTFEEFSEVLERQDDKIYVVNFWATWCKPCVAELPFFEKLPQDYTKEQVEVILVSLDFKEKIKKNLIPFIEKNNVKSEVVLLADTRTNEWIDQVDESWSGTIPATLIYDQESYQFLEHEFESYEELKSLIKEFSKS